MRLTDSAFTDESNEGKVKDGLNEFIVNGIKDAVSEENQGTKLGIDYKTRINAKSYESLRLRLTSGRQTDFLKGFDDIFEERIREAE